jgi:hypothetical protein
VAASPTWPWLLALHVHKPVIDQQAASIASWSKIHLQNVTSKKLLFPLMMQVVYSQQDLLSSMMPVWHKLLQTGGM